MYPFFVSNLANFLDRIPLLQTTTNFLFFENGIEINRIVEFPVVNLLDDFSKILKKQSYKNSYSDF